MIQDDDDLHDGLHSPLIIINHRVQQATLCANLVVCQAESDTAAAQNGLVMEELAPLQFATHVRIVNSSKLITRTIDI